MNSTMKRHPLFKPVAALAGVFLALFIAEAAAAFWVKIVIPWTDPATARELEIIEHNDRRWMGHPYTNFAPTPGFRITGIQGDVISQHNSLGFRGAEFTKEKPAGTFRVVLLGGSAAYSSRIPEDSRTITTRLQANLYELGYKNVQVINAGVSAYSTAEALGELQFRVLELSPDLVIVYEAINDLHNRYVPPDLFFADNRGRVRVWPGQEFPWWTTSYLGRLIGRKMGLLNKSLFVDYYVAAPTYLGHTSEVKNVDYAAILKRNGTKYFRENLVSILAICRIRKIGVMIASYASTDERKDLGYLKTKNYEQGLREMNETIRDFAKEFSVPYFDYASVMPKDASLWRDEVHVTAEGAAVTGKLFANFIVQNGLIKK